MSGVDSECPHCRDLGQACDCLGCMSDRMRDGSGALIAALLPDDYDADDPLTAARDDVAQRLGVAPGTLAASWGDDRRETIVVRLR